MVIGLLLLLAPVAMAGPGGEIVELAFKTKIGRIISLVLAIIFLPLIIYVYWREYLKVRRTKKDLEELAKDWPEFDWLKIQTRVSLVARKLYSSWSLGEIGGATEYLTMDYCQSQQAILDRWKAEGKRNVTTVEKYGKCRPLRLMTPSWDHPAVIYVGVEMKLMDYMEDVRKGSVMKGSKKKWVEAESIFLMIFSEGEWLLHAIEKEDQSLVIASEENFVDTTYLRSQKSSLESSTVDPAEGQFPAQQEKTMVEVAKDGEDERGPGEVNKGPKEERE
jgi:hypothetical protein